MRHFPIYLDLQDARVVVSGTGETAVAKLRLLLKTPARISVFGRNPSAQIIDWANADRLALIERPVEAADTAGVRLFYAANDDDEEDHRAANIGRAAGALVNIVDNVNDSQFITPAIVDRDPVTVAIGTEGAAPVLARRIKSELEARLEPALGPLASIGKIFRAAVEVLPQGRTRREFWSRYYDDVGPRAWATGGAAEAKAALVDLLQQHLADNDAREKQRGRVWLAGAGPGDPDLLTNKARRVLHDADVVIHDRLVSGAVLELVRREAQLIDVGKTPGGRSWSQDAINALMVAHARAGAHVVRLKSGDPTIFGRLDEEMDALDDAGIEFEIIPGVTSALAAAARIKSSLTQRQRNSDFRILTGQDIRGFTEHDWRAIVRPGTVAAIYMGVRAARFLQGRLVMHGADAQTPVTAIENVSRHDEKTVSTTLGAMHLALADADIKGPAIIFLGLSPRDSEPAKVSDAEILVVPHAQTGVQ